MRLLSEVGEGERGGERERRWRASSWSFMEFHSKASLKVVKTAQSPFFGWFLTLWAGEEDWEKPTYCIALWVSPFRSHAGWLIYYELPALWMPPALASCASLRRRNRSFPFVAMYTTGVFVHVSAARMNCSGSWFHRHVYWSTFAMAGNMKLHSVPVSGVYDWCEMPRSQGECM